MKTSRQCPKCSSKQVVLLASNLASKIYRSEPSAVERYACTDCGFIEEYLVDAKELTELKKKLKS